MEGPVAAPRLAPGDRVRVIAPAGPVPRAEFEAGMAVLGQRYEVLYDGAVLSRDGFLAGDDVRRRSELEQALTEEGSKALFCARGGYGILRLLPGLDQAAQALARAPRPIVGFSDVTALLFWAVARAGVRGVHGPVVTQLGKLPSEDVEALWRLLEQPTPPPLGSLRALVAGAPVSGRLLGGNLEVLTRLLGTPWQPDLRGAVLLIEEIGERPYRIDRLLTHLLLARALDGLAGVVVGDFIGCEEPAGTLGSPSPSALEVVAERLSPLGVPVVADAPVGHGARNRALPMGARVTLDATAGRLTFLEGAVV